MKRIFKKLILMILILDLTLLLSILSHRICPICIIEKILSNLLKKFLLIKFIQNEPILN